MTCKLCRRFYLFVIFPIVLSGCGVYTPSKDPFRDDVPGPTTGTTNGGNYENSIVNHVTCEIAQGLYQAKKLELSWLMDWGTTVTQSITAEDQSGLAPGITSINPFQNGVIQFPVGGNVVSPQSFSVSVGGTASANALRTETIQYTFRNRDILRLANPETCTRELPGGVLIDGDLKIREFIYDKALIARLNNASLVAGDDSPFNTFTEEITFVAAYGSSFTPTWKLVRLTANTSSNLIVAQRTNTNDLVITLGPLNPAWIPRPNKPIPRGPVELTQAAMTQHNTRVQAAAIAVSVIGQSH